jgi:D-serine deaminase-like pyridoxal phosphate-dependent protein
MTDSSPIQVPDDLETPALLVDAGLLDLNLERMAAAARAQEIGLRPHAKTHKCAEIARRQLAHGASGLTVATLDEAEMFADAGCDSLFIAYPLWAGGIRRSRVAALNERTGLRIGVDSEDGAGQLAKVAPGLQVLIEVDSGQHRTGVLPEDVGKLAAACERLGLNVIGAFSHPGHAYDTPANAGRAAEDERAALATAADSLAAGPVLSGGSTPTAYDGVARPLTEVRPGTYVFADRQQHVMSGKPVSEIALVVAARVVSTPRAGEAVLDSGSKALSSDRAPWLTGHGILLEAPEATVAYLTEEHAVVRGLQTRLAVGDLVRVIPNHVCTVVNLAREMLVVSGGAITDRWPVSSRRARR